MLEALSGETRLFTLIGHPIAQVMSPAGMTRALAASGRNAAVIPLHVEPAAVDSLIDSLVAVHNIDGILATVPHKFTAYRHAATATARAHTLGAANILRRNADRTWHGDMLDGVSMVAAIRTAGGEITDRRALLVGAGGAGSAIALGLLDAGVRQLAIHDSDMQRRDALIGKLQLRDKHRVVIGSSDPSGFDLVVNATPAGMKPDDPMPVDVKLLRPSTFVADVITKPVVTPLLAAAQDLGCGCQTGAGMFETELALMLEFLFGASTTEGVGCDQNAPETSS
jgi:shikimate dehydrogenase